MIIKTKRFVLKKIKLRDANQNYANWFNDKEIKNNIQYASKKQNIALLKKYIKNKSNKSNVIFLAIRVKKNNNHIGNIKFEPFDNKNKETTMGIMIGDPKWRGKGLAKEVLEAFSIYLNKKYGSFKIFLAVSRKNIKAIRAYEKTGFIEYSDQGKVDKRNIKMVLYTNYGEKYTVGTANFGNKYGIKNKEKKLSLSNSKKILLLANQNKIKNIDTAIAYGNSQNYIGKLYAKKYKVSTKLEKIPLNLKNLEIWFNENINNSLKFLNIKKIDTLILHYPKDLLGKNGKSLYKLIQSLKNKKIINKFGISLYNINEIYEYSSKYKIDVVQIPFNIIDRRILNNNTINYLNNKKIEIHIRSIFMQGLLLMKNKDRPKKFMKWKSIWKNYENWIKKSKLNKLEACLGYALSFPQFDKIIIGCDNVNQLAEILKIKKSVVNPPRNISTNDKKLINPFNWKKL